jgi:hypothetical protein
MESSVEFNWADSVEQEEDEEVNSDGGIVEEFGESDDGDESYSIAEAIGKSPSDEVLELLGIPIDFRQEVVVCDMWNDLQLIHYTRCSDDSPDFIKQVRGIVVDTKRNCIVCRSTPFTTEIVTNDTVKIEKYIPEVMSDVYIHEAAEGTVVRVFHDGSKWLWTTHHNLDAYDSKWGNTTFGNMFKECIDRVGHKMFNQDICYAFLMSHPENTIVCHDQPMHTLYLIAAYNRNSDGLTPIPFSELPELPGIRVVGTHHSRISRDEVISMTTRANIADTSGYILRIGDVHIKLSNPHYMMFRNIRGDNPNINIRYLELTRSKNFTRAQMFMDMNARYCNRFSRIEDEIRQLCSVVYNFYVGKYITKRCTNVPSTEYIAVRYIHQWHVQGRRTNVVTKEKVARLIGQMPPADIWKLIRDRIIVK